jgi:hypothetical protein
LAEKVDQISKLADSADGNSSGEESIQVILAAIPTPTRELNEELNCADNDQARGCKNVLPL